MRCFVDLPPGWSPDAAARVGRAGGIPLREGPDLPTPVLRRVPGALPDDLRPGDHALLTGEVSRLAAACRARGVVPWAVVETPAAIEALRDEDVGLWLRGMECAGTIPAFTALTLIRAVGARRPFVVEGLGTRGMAASVAVGAEGIVLGPQLWAHGPAPLPVDRPLSGRDTRVEGETSGQRRRTLRGVPAPQALAEVARYADRADAGAVVEAVREAVERHLRTVTEVRATLVQGPMANVGENERFAAAVARAGAMPFAALGALDPEQATDVLRRHEREVQGPWGAGIVAFDVQPHRDAHLERALQSGAEVITLAGGTPELALRLQAAGKRAWLHTPSARLVGRALRRGVDGVILEGHEAGGHVGGLTSAGLWEEGLAAVEEAAAAGVEAPTVVLAGGIGDAISAAFAMAMAAPAVHAGARLALQAGTAFFFTHEIVETGAITPEYQRQALACGETALVGSTVGLPLRCPTNAFVEEARRQEAAWLAEGLPLAERRLRMERLNVGRARIAAKAIERSPGWPAEGPRYRPVPPDRQRAEGAFTMGQGAAVARRLVALPDLVHALTAEARALLARRRGPTGARWGDVRPVGGLPSTSSTSAPAPVRRGEEDPIAIVALGCVLPGAADLQGYWRSLVHGHDAVAPLPEDRWPAARYHDLQAGVRGPVKSYARLGAAVGPTAFDPLRYGIPPRALRAVDPAQRLALLAADQATAMLGSLASGARAAVILGNSMGGEHAKSTALRVRFREVLDAVREVDPMDDERFRALEEGVEALLEERLPPIEVHTLAGSLSNVIAGRVASWLDWMGGALTVDAACAASLAALSVAVDWLRSGRADVVLTGGVDADLSPETFVGFSRTGALSARGSSPFGADADGFVMGEGCGVLVLERLSDALANGHPVWAVIRGIGQSSDGRGKAVTAPREQGQLLALERAFAEAGVEPGSVGMIEAHGTGTRVGDRVELAALHRFFGRPDGPIWVGSVKSQIGHLKSAAGAAGLLKATLALATGVVPPTLHAGPVNAELALADGPFRLPRSPTPFPSRAPRRAGVSAFGFGGTNFHIVLEEAPPQARRPELAALLRREAEPLLVGDVDLASWPLDAPPAPEAPRLAVFAGESPAALRDAVREGRSTSAEDAARAPHRLVLVGTDAEAALAWLEGGPRPPGAFAGSGPPVAPVFLVPGQGTQRPGALAVLRRIPVAQATLRRIEARIGPLDPLEADAGPLALHRLLFAEAVAWGAVLREAGIRPASTAGHSLGEVAALVLAGRLTVEEGLTLAEARGEALEACPEGRMLAVELGPEEAEQEGLHLAVVNGPRACVLSGSGEAVQRAKRRLRERGVPSVVLAVRRAFHSPFVDSAREPFAHAIRSARFDDGLPWWSAAGATPDAPPGEALLEALTRPVRFHETLVAMQASGLTLAVEVGPGAVLTRHAAGLLDPVPLDPRPGDPRGPAHAAAALLAAGHPGLVRVLALGTAPPRTRAAPSPPARTPAPGPSSPVHEAVVAAIVEVTGYPPDALVAGADLEGDLGVDSVRKMEVLGLLEERLGVRPRDGDGERLASLDLDGLVAWVEERLASPDVEAPAEARPRLLLPVDLPLEASAGGPWEGAVVRIEAEPGPVPERVARAIARLREVEGPLALVVDDGDPAGAAAAAFARSLARERDHAVRIVRRRGNVSEERVEAALALDRPEIVVLARSLQVPGTLPFRPEAAAFPPRPILLATGGATGVVARCLLALADLEPRVVLLGRRDPAEVREAIGALTEAGIDLRYVVADVCDPDDVRRAVDEARALGPLDLVLHGAGVRDDCTVDRLDEASIARVLEPKLLGAAHLMEATRSPAPRLWVALGSVAAWTGNAGQSVYAAVNAALEHWPHPTAGRSVTVASTAWRGVGMAADRGVQAALSAAGVRPLAPEEGAVAIRAAIGAGVSRVAVTAQPLPDTASPWPLGEAIAWGPSAFAFSVPLDPADPRLDHHRVAGRALVPAALWVRALDAAARLVAPGRTLGLADFDVLAPTFVERPREDVRLRLSVAGDAFLAEVRAGEVLLARARLVPPGTERAGTSEPRLGASVPAGPLYRPDLLFHGPTWRMLDRIASDGNGTLAADLLATGGVDTLTGAVDAAHQVLSVGSGLNTGWLGLPVGAARWELWPRDVRGPLRLVVSARPAEDGIVGDAVVRDASGGVVLRGVGIRLRRAARWPLDAPHLGVHHG